ncbi:cutinase family protein [Rhodococcus hoagii]|nr:cutinase family protein [Prescottella equi]NKS61633.1 cutinase family protein [Prescottella equi]NKZ93262.1 cutinase family protein [Prescottella equi]
MRVKIRGPLAVASSMAMIVMASGVATADPSTTPSTSSTGTASATVADSSNCPALHLVLINGTTESAPEMNPDVDSGFMSQIAVPAALAVNGTSTPKDSEKVLDRTYVPYSASFGGKPGDHAKDPYAKSVSMGIDNAKAILSDIGQQCPNSKVFVSGFSQGGQAASAIVRDIGHGKGPIADSQLAGAALFSDPTREAGSPVFPGAPAQSSPKPAPGTSGESTSEVTVAQVSTPAGGGIAPNSADRGFGSVAGRVASFCTTGDLACDTPADAPIARMVANIAGQSSLDANDPIGALSSVGTAVGQTVLLTGASVVNNNLDFNTKAGRFEMKQGRETVLNRMVRYSQPADPAQVVTEAVRAVTKLAGMGIGAAVTVAKTVLAPESIVQIAAAGVAGPQAAVAALGARLLDATIQLFPPVTVNQAVQFAYREVEQGIVDNQGLARIAFDTRYWQAAAQHGSYGSVPVGVSGETATQFTTDWIVALAKDLTGSDKIADSTKKAVDQAGPLLAVAGASSRSATDILASAPESTATAAATASPMSTAPSASSTTSAAQPSDPASVGTSEPATASPVAE